MRSPRWAHAIPRPRRSDLVLAGAIAVIAQVETWSTASYEPKGAYALAALGMTVPVAWRRVAPLVVLALVFLPLVAMGAAGKPLDSAFVMLVLLASFSAVGAFCERRRAVAGLTLGLGLLAVAVVVERALAGEREAPAVGDFVFIAAIVAAVWGLAVGLRERSLRAGELEKRADLLEREREEQARAAVAAERSRIARELHDVVAHAVSVVAVQTGSMRRRLRHERPADAEQLSAIEETARQALAEMRRMLGLLRADDEALSLAPQPGVGEVDRLIAQLRDAGLTVDLQVEGRRRPLSPGVDLAAYRIIQEALTNILKHAGPARARVEVRFGDRELELEVADDGRGPGPDGGGGHGLVGMRERAALYGGSLETGGGPDGGFVVHARLPLTSP